jgi:hypothetical protein
VSTTEVDTWHYIKKKLKLKIKMKNEKKKKKEESGGRSGVAEPPRGRKKK